MSAGDGRILVTGGAGFIGSFIVDELVARGADVVVLDNLSPAAHPARPDYLNASAQYLWGDVADADAWDEALTGVTAVCHQAARVGLGVDYGDAPRYVADNDVGWVVGLEALHRRRFAGRIVLASSMVVYGEGRYRCDEHGTVSPGPRRVDDLEGGRFEPPCPVCAAQLQSELVPESAPTDPRNVYAATKLHQEHLLSAFAREHPAVTACSLRYHNVYGPRMPRDTPYAGVASIFRSALAGGRAPGVNEDGRQCRDFVHVADVADINVVALLGETPVVGPINVGSGTPHTVGEMAEALAAAMGATPGDERWPLVTGDYRLGDVRHVVADTARLRAIPGRAASTTFEAGMGEFASAQLRAPVVAS